MNFGEECIYGMGELKQGVAMSVRCLNCKYEMSTNQEVQSLIGKIAGGLWEVFKDSAKRPNLERNFVAGSLNSTAFGEPVECPNCKTRGQWEDC